MTGVNRQKIMIYIIIFPYRLLCSLGLLVGGTVEEVMELLEGGS